MIRALVAVGLLAVGANAGAQDRPPVPLQTVLTQCGCLLTSMPESLLSTMVDDYDYLKDDAGFVVAYWTTPHDYNRFDEGQWDVIAGDPRTGQWRHAQMAAGPDVGSWGGSFGGIERQRGLIVISMRVAIDGDARSILTPDLQRLAAVYANDLHVFPGGIVLYRNPQPHFQPTHYVTMTLLDLRSRDDAHVYPAMPYDRVRGEETRRLESFWKTPAGQKACEDAGLPYGASPCIFPEDFETELWSESPVVNAATGGLAFGVRYLPDASPADARFDVVVACEHATTVKSTTCHETALAQWQKIFPGATRDQILQDAAENPTRVPWK